MDSEPMRAGNFAVTFDDERVDFSEVAGLGYEPEQHRATAVTLRRGVERGRTLWTWARDPVPRMVTVTLFDATLRPVCSYILRQARPTKWTGPALNATSSDVAMEELELTADGIEVRPHDP